MNKRVSFRNDSNCLEISDGIFDHDALLNSEAAVHSIGSEARKILKLTHVAFDRETEANYWGNLFDPRVFDSLQIDRVHVYEDVPWPITKAIESNNRLTSLAIAATPIPLEACDDFAAKLAFCLELETFSLAWSGEDMAPIQIAIILSGLKSTKLRKLTLCRAQSNLYAFTTDSVNQLVRIVASNPTLTHIELVGLGGFCYKDGKNPFIDALCGCNELTHVNFACNNIDDDFLRKWFGKAKGKYMACMQKVSHLSLADNEMIMDYDALGAAVASLPRLEILHLPKASIELCPYLKKCTELKEFHAGHYEDGSSAGGHHLFEDAVYKFGPAFELAFLGDKKLAVKQSSSRQQQRFR